MGCIWLRWHNLCSPTCPHLVRRKKIAKISYFWHIFGFLPTHKCIFPLYATHKIFSGAANVYEQIKIKKGKEFTCTLSFDVALCPQLQDKFRLDLTDEEAVHYMQTLIDISVTAVFAAVAEQFHKFAQVSYYMCGRLTGAQGPFPALVTPLTCRHWLTSVLQLSLLQWLNNPTNLDRWVINGYHVEWSFAGEMVT